MKALLPGLPLLLFLLAGCDSNTAEAPPPGDVTPIAKTSTQGKYLPGTVPPTAATGPANTRQGRPATVEPGAATPKAGGGDWLWKGYKNPLDRPTPKKK